MSSKNTILVVEDDDDYLSAIHTFLSQHYTVITATNCSEAGLLFEQHQHEIKAITLDIILPDGTAFTLYEQFRSISSFIPPIIVVSALNSTEDRIQTMTTFNAFTHINKPFNNHDLKQHIDSAIQNYMTKRHVYERNREDIITNALFKRRLKLMKDYAEFCTKQSLSINYHDKPSTVFSEDAQNKELSPAEIVSLFENDCGFPAPAQKSPTILIVEDEVGLNAFMVTFFREKGYHVESALTGKDAKNAMESLTTIDIVLLDVNLPDLSGIDLAPIIKQHPSSPDIIAVTAYKEVKEIESVIIAGVYKYITKPFDNNHLLSVVEETLERRHCLLVLPLLLKRLIDQPLSFRFRKALLSSHDEPLSTQDILDVYPDFHSQAFFELHTEYDSDSIDEGLSDMVRYFLKEHPSKGIMI